MSAYGYIHTPTGNSNDYNTQKYSILAFAASTNMSQVHFCHESVPDQLHDAKPILSGMISTLQREDVIIVYNFASLGCSTVEVLGILSTLARTGVKLYVVNSGFRLADNMQSQLVVMACSLVAEVEKELKLHPEQEPVPIQMQREDADPPVSARRTRKSKLDGRRSEIEELLSTGISMSEAARQLGVSRPTLTDWVDSRNLSVQNPPATM